MLPKHSIARPHALDVLQTAPAICGTAGAAAATKLLVGVEGAMGNTRAGGFRHMAEHRPPCANQPPSAAACHADPLAAPAKLCGASLT